MNDGDAVLLARSRSGDSAAFETLLRRYVRPAFLVAMAQLGEPSDAEDACQDAFVRCWERLDECRDGDRFAAWLLRIVRNTAHNYREYLDVRSGRPVQDISVPDPSSADAFAERRELRAILWDALRHLGERQREVVLLHDLHGWRHAEIAEKLEISEVMSRRDLSDARRILRGLLGKATSHLEER
jgi:RNA polymerase sigma-70 factor, ECF subfamily